MHPSGLEQADLERKHIELIKAYGKDLRDVSEAFNRQKDKSATGRYLERNGPPLYCNMPPCSGALYWVCRVPALGLPERAKARLFLPVPASAHCLYYAPLAAATQSSHWPETLVPLFAQSLTRTPGRMLFARRCAA